MRVKMPAAKAPFPYDSSYFSQQNRRAEEKTMMAAKLPTRNWCTAQKPLDVAF